MRQRLISICITGILVCCICGCAQTTEEIPVAEQENVEAKYTETESEGDADAENVKTESVAQTDSITDAVEQEEQMPDNLSAQEEHEPEKESYIVTEQVISDFLSMDAVEFQESYDKDDLYQSGILYCGHDAWKYDGNQVDAFQEPGDYYDVANITAIRFYKEQPVPVYLNMNINDQSGQCIEEISIDYHTDYAVSIYSMPADNGLSCIQEISYVKIELYSGTAPEDLYHFIEGNYYKVREELKNETWILSPDGDKAACVSNGGLPKHPSQIFVWQGVDKPLTVFRETWELRVVGWIDNDHLVCDKIDIAPPILVHLERNEIEKITEERNFDTYGAKYSIQGSYLIAQPYAEEQYQWQIKEKDGEIYIAEPD